MPAVVSEAIRSIDYDPLSKELFIVFNSGPKRYTYFDVPAQVYSDFLRAESHGTFFHRYIRDQYSVA